MSEQRRPTYEERSEITNEIENAIIALETAVNRYNDWLAGGEIRYLSGEARTAAWRAANQPVDDARAALQIAIAARVKEAREEGQKKRPTHG